MRYELTDLKVFMAIADIKNLTNGALSMHMSAPAASYRLKNLEQALGASLFNRTPAGMILTTAGETVYRYAESILSDVEKLHGEMSRYTSNVIGYIRVFANSSTLSALPVPLSLFLAEHPNINVDLEEHMSETTVRAIYDGIADIGLIANVVHLRGLESIPYNWDELVLVTPLNHPLTKIEKVTIDIALEHDLVSVGRKSSNFLYLQKLAATLNRHMRVRVHVPNFEAALGCVQRGAGISLVPLSVAEKHTKQGIVQIVKIDEPWAKRRQTIVVRSISELPDYSRSFIKILCESSQKITPNA